MTKIIDLNFKNIPETIAAFVLETEDGPIIIETGPYSTFPALEAGLKELGYRVDEVQHVFLTHIHLDHAGAAWAFAERGATICVHPAGVTHLADPSRLMDSAKRIYQDQMDALWGEMRPIPLDQIRAVEHGEEIGVGGRMFQSWHTPGHASHHIAWQVGNELFTGDVAGIKILGGPVSAPCPPPDIHIEHWQASIQLIRSLNLERCYLTHYGIVTEIAEHLDSLEKLLLDWVDWMKPHFEQGKKAQDLISDFQAYVKQQIMASGVTEEVAAKYEVANPSWMSVAGLLRYWKKRSQEA